MQIVPTDAAWLADDDGAGCFALPPLHLRSGNLPEICGEGGGVVVALLQFVGHVERCEAACGRRVAPKRQGKGKDEKFGWCTHDSFHIRIYATDRD